MNDHPMSKKEPKDIKYIKRLQIYVLGSAIRPIEKGMPDKKVHDEALVDVPLDGLRFRIVGLEAADESDLGRPIGADNVSALINDFIHADFGSPKPLTETQLDFKVQEPCCVVLKLIGPFWEFMPNPPKKDQPVRMKKKAGDRYRKLERHYKDGRLQAVSFYVQEVYPKKDDKRDGINLYVDFIEDELRLPVIIDPDIENVGNAP